MSLAPPRVVLRYDVERVSDDWILSEEPVPESRLHDLVLDLLKAILVYELARAGRPAIVARNLAVRWDPTRPRMGADPDLCVIEPPPPEGDELTSLELWKPGHTAPIVAIEVVSTSNPKKDYTSAPEKHAAAGARELWVFDPELAGPRVHGGPFRLQLWARDADGEFTRIYTGPGPVRSPAIGGWLFAVDEGRRLRIAADEAGTEWWPTAEEAERAAKEAERAAKEAERAAKEAERAAKEAERAAKEAALRRVAELEAEIAKRGG